MEQLRLEDVLGAAGKVKVLLLLIGQEEMNISQIVKLSGLEHSSVQKHLKSLCDQHLVREKRYGRIRIFALEEKNPYVALLKRFFADWRRLGEGQAAGYA
ncbi:MAG TPA: helix-turn-helix transcriptional regulator [Conexivisphaerales archaeon]|nr:helix-turn-helix transcriptional regulator [Conexivisphaerales archaeon]